MSKCVILKNDASEDFGRGICHNVDADLVIDSENQPLGDDHVAISIAKSLSEEYVPSDWMFQLCGWLGGDTSCMFGGPMCGGGVFLEGLSITYNHYLATLKSPYFYIKGKN